jgi:hypothetical protein
LACVARLTTFAYQADARRAGIASHALMRAAANTAGAILRKMLAGLGTVGLSSPLQVGAYRNDRLSVVKKLW